MPVIFLPGSSDMLGPAMINNLEDIKKHLAEGGNLICISGRNQKP